MKIKSTISLLYTFLLLLIILIGTFNFYRFKEVTSQTVIYKQFLFRAAGELPPIISDKVKRNIELDSLLENGKYLLVTLSPHDCPVCLEREIRFLKVLHKEVPALPIIIIVSYYPSKGEIEPWLREWGLDFPYYFDPENTLEKMNGLRPSEAWNILVKNGQVITSFLPEENYFYKRAIFEFLHEYLKKIK